MRPSPLRWIVVLFACMAITPLFAHEDPKYLADRQGPQAAGPQLRGGLTGSATGDFPSSGITLMGWLPLDRFGSQASGADCWGYTSGSGREYAIIGLSDGVSFVEVTDPGNPTVVQTLSAVNSLWRDVKVYQDYAYYVSEGGDGIKVVNLSNIDSGSVNIVRTVNTPGTSATHNVAIDTESGFLYRCGGGGSTVGLRIYSLANPSNPSLVGQWHNRYVHDAQIVTYTSGPYAGKQVAFCFSENGAGGGSAGVDILDVTNKSSITTMSTLFYSNPNFSHQGWLSEDRNYLYINDELDEINGGGVTRTRVANVSNLNSPSQVGTFTSGTNAVDHNLYTLGNQIFEANYRSGLRVFDSSNPTSPTETAYFDTYPADDAADFNGLWSVYPYFASGTVIGSDIEKGLFIWRMGDPWLTFSVQGGVPAMVNPLGDIVDVDVTAQNGGVLQPGSVTLNYDTGSGFQQSAMLDLGGGTYRAQFPAIPCGSSVNYYFSAQTTDGATWTGPEAAPTYQYIAGSGFGAISLVDEDMETNPSWTVGFAGDTASTGIWTRVNPNGTAAQPEDDHSDPGVRAWVTGQGAVGGGLGDNDVDGGKTTLVTSTINLAAGDATISYWRWYSNNAGSAPGADVFRVDISNNNGTTWTNVETVGPTGSGTIGGWVYHQFLVSDFKTPTSQVKVRFVAEDAGSGSIIEAAIDDFKVDRFDCTGTCQTDLGFKGPGNATLSICGATLDSGNIAEIRLENAPASQLGFFVVGSGNTPTPFRGGTLVPIPVVNLSAFLTNGAGELIANTLGGGGPGTLYLQAIISDPGQAQGVSLSNALQLAVGP